MGASGLLPGQKQPGLPGVGTLWDGETVWRDPALGLRDVTLPRREDRGE